MIMVWWSNSQELQYKYHWCHVYILLLLELEMLHLKAVMHILQRAKVSSRAPMERSLANPYYYMYHPEQGLQAAALVENSYFVRWSLGLGWQRARSVHRRKQEVLVLTL